MHTKCGWSRRWKFSMTFVRARLVPRHSGFDLLATFRVGLRRLDPGAAFVALVFSVP